MQQCWDEFESVCLVMECREIRRGEIWFIGFMDGVLQGEGGGGGWGGGMVGMRGLGPPPTGA